MNWVAVSLVIGALATMACMDRARADEAADMLAAALAADERHDYATEFKLLRPLAEQGNPAAQGLLGTLYQYGVGVAQDYAEAVRWFSRAAEQGYGGGQYALGAMYADGEGVPKDYVSAYMWASLAAAQSSNFTAPLAADLRDRLAQIMTPDQIAEGQRRTTAWKPSSAITKSGP